jgi:integrase
MGRRREETRHDRYLIRRGDTFQYVRRVPSEVVAFDNRAPMIRQSLRTSELGKAMALRDIHERADNELWAALLVGTPAEIAMRGHRQTVARAAALGYTYRSAADIAAHELPMAIVERVEKASKTPVGSPEEIALLGMADDKDQTITAAFETYCTEIARDEIRGKSPAQRHAWKIRKAGAVTTFVEICGDKRMGEVSRDDARKVYAHFMDRIAPKTGKATLGANMGNRQIGTLRVLFREWHKFHGNDDAKNPFDGLSFVEKKSAKTKHRRPPFSVEWISTRLLAKGALDGLNPQARGILLALVETGARLSEIANLKADNIVLDGSVPHIKIEPSEDPDDPREIKTDSSVRVVPLVGVSLAAMKKHKKGFPRYRDKGNSLSAALNKFLKTNGLLETPDHVVYSLRHSMEDRMKDGRIDEEIRRMIMGHTIDRPRYGSGGSLERKHEDLMAIALPYDPKIV